jgi:hypothetical protein
MDNFRDFAVSVADDRIVSHRELLICCLKYMSQDDVRDMLEINELILDEDYE